jgi:hypothetical protein
MWLDAEIDMVDIEKLRTKFHIHGLVSGSEVSIENLDWVPFPKVIPEEGRRARLLSPHVSLFPGDFVSSSSSSNKHTVHSTTPCTTVETASICCTATICTAQAVTI